jgi:hypothetical protein
MNRLTILSLLSGAVFCVVSGCAVPPQMKRSFNEYVLANSTPVDPALQAKLQQLDADLRGQFGMTTDQTAVGVLDLNALRLAMLHPDREEYAASVPKVGILLAYFELHPEAATNLSGQPRHELGLMVKASDNEMAAKFSREMGLKPIQAALNTYHLPVSMASATRLFADGVGVGSRPSLQPPSSKSNYQNGPQRSSC